jgi:phage terminase large subunit GpA-like protein
VLHTGDRWDRDLEFLRLIMDDFADEGVSEQACMCSAQSCKTVTNMGLQGWMLCEDPGPALWVTKSAPEAKKLVKGRLWPMYDNTPVIADRLPKEKGKRNLLEMYFPGMYLHVVGADNEGSLQSTPYRYLFLDEVRQWKDGALAMVRKRTRSYPHNFKHVTISCPDMEGDAVHRAFLRGNQNHWHVKCRSEGCETEFRLEWGEKGKRGGLKWDKNDVTCPEGKWNLDEVVKTLRFECPGCGTEYRDIKPSQKDRKYFCRSGRWIPANPNAPSNTKSYHWNALLPHFTSWEDQLKEFLAARDAMKWGDFEDFKDHWCETRGLPWTDRLRFAKEEKFLDERIRPYGLNDKAHWEVRRIMTVDFQGKGGAHYWVEIRAWGYEGRSRLLHFGRAMSEIEIDALAAQYGVEEVNIAYDTAWDTARAYQMVMKSGYKRKAMRGEDRAFFLQSNGGVTIKRIWDVSAADPALGTTMAGRLRPIQLYRFSKPATLERLYLFMYGHLGDWQIHEETSMEYKQQVTAWDRRYRTNNRGEEISEWYQKRSDDHATDTGRMQIAVADITGLLRPPRDGELPMSVEEGRGVEPL